MMDIFWDHLGKKGVFFFFFPWLYCIWDVLETSSGQLDIGLHNLDGDNLDELVEDIQGNHEYVDGDWSPES